MKIKDLKIRVVDVPPPASLDKTPVKPNKSNEILKQEFERAYLKLVGWYANVNWKDNGVSEAPSTNTKAKEKKNW